MYNFNSIFNTNYWLHLTPNIKKTSYYMMKKIPIKYTRYSGKLKTLQKI